MAVALRGAVTTGTSGTATVSVNAPTGLTAGDVIVLWVVNTFAGAVSSTGFTAATFTSNANNEGLLWKVATGSEGASFSVSLSGGAGGGVICAAFSGAAGGVTVFDPSNPANATSNSGNSATASAVGPTTLVNGDMILWLLDYFGSGGIVGAPAGFTATTLNAINGTNTLNAQLAYEAQATAGAVGTVSKSQTSSFWAANCVAVKAALPTAGNFFFLY